MSPQTGRKMQSECSWPKAVRAASSKIWTLIRPISPVDPLVEDGAEEIAPGFGRDGVGADAAGAPGRRSTSGRKVTNAAPISRKKP